ncbi:MAG: GntR family transcriptional regulator, partial [Bacillota bacterium]|nr:GntR family transcriptional regulator [Bacillota bacterium]
MKESANLEIYNELKRRIIELEYEPGSAINEKDLVNEFQVSRTPIREALLRLSQIGLVEMRPRVGTF